MKLICPRCQYQGLVDASPDDGVIACARCGAPLDQLLWPDSQVSSLTMTTAAATTAVVDQRIMKNQNTYAPTAESVGDDVLEIPRPVKSTQNAGDQMHVLEDVIPMPPAHELSGWEDELDPDMLDVDEDETLLQAEDEHESLSLAAARLEESDAQTRSEILGAAQASAIDYDGYRAWIRIAPLLLLVGALVFFTLYYLGNRMGGGDRAQNAATNPATPETPNAIPGGAPENAETATQTSQPAESSVVGAKAESPTPNENIKVETATQPAPAATQEAVRPAREAPTTVASVQSAAQQPAPVASPVVAQPAPVVASQGSGNYTIQVGSYNNAAQAEERVARLASSGVEARVVRAEIPRRGTWYRVQTGRFASQEEATRYGAQLKGKGATDDYIITAAQSQ
jgi:cell division protein FtsN